MKDIKLKEDFPGTSYKLLSEFVGYRIFLGNQIYDMPKDRMDALELIASYYHKLPFDVTKQDMKNCLTYDEEGYIDYTDDFKNFLKRKINMKKDSKKYKISIITDSSTQNWTDLWHKYVEPMLDRVFEASLSMPEEQFHKYQKKEAEQIDELCKAHQGEHAWDTLYIKFHENDDDYDEDGNPIEDSNESKEELPDEIKERRKNAVLMNKVISSMNNEEAYYGSWLYEWVDEGDIEDGYYDEKEDYDDLKDSFKQIYKRYHKDGLYKPDEETIKFAHKWDRKLELEPIEIIK